MRTLSRPYEPGDEVQINRLYLLITGRDRSAAEFAWEWLDTWAGRGSIDLVFDLDREEGDQLIAQYSLIPTPLSVWGRPTVAGKTENCMSHPDIRGSGLYSAHERECFEKRKQKFSFFFTTTGQVAGGAVGKVRTRLGYTAFDDWANYTMWMRTRTLYDDLRSVVASKGRVGRVLAPVLAGLLTTGVQAWSRVRARPVCGHRVVAHGGADVPLDEVADLWERNRRYYGITVDRTADYLRWRVNDDPHVEHAYLAVRDEQDRLVGSVIYFEQDQNLHVVDVIVDRADDRLFRCLLTALVRRARELRVERIRCLVLRRSRLLPRQLRRAGFFDMALLSPATFLKRSAPSQFLLYIPEGFRGVPAVADRDSWYINALVLEGLPRPTSSA